MWIIFLFIKFFIYKIGMCVILCYANMPCGSRNLYVQAVVAVNKTNTFLCRIWCLYFTGNSCYLYYIQDENVGMRMWLLRKRLITIMKIGSMTKSMPMTCNSHFARVPKRYERDLNSLMKVLLKRRWLWKC